METKTAQVRLNVEHRERIKHHLMGIGLPYTNQDIVNYALDMTVINIKNVSNGKG